MAWRQRARNSRTAALALACAAAVALGACTPPTQPSPGVVVPPAGQGRDPEATVAPSSGCDSPTGPLPSGRSSLVVDVGGVNRWSLVDVPATVPSSGSPAPLLVSLHPFLMGPDGWDAYSGLSAAGTARGYVVLTPLGSDPGPRWTVPGGLASDSDDLAFIAALVDRVAARTCTDRNRVFAAGFSAGAAMAQALSCTMPERFAAVAGSGGVNLTSLCPDSPATDVLVLHGTADPIAPPGGSEIVFAPPIGLPVTDTLATDAARAGCDQLPVVDQPAPTVRHERWLGCADGHRVEALWLLGAGHTWAGSSNPLLEVFTGPTDTDVSATDEVLDFFDAA